MRVCFANLRRNGTSRGKGDAPSIPIRREGGYHDEKIVSDADRVRERADHARRFELRGQLRSKRVFRGRRQPTRSSWPGASTFAFPQELRAQTFTASPTAAGHGVDPSARQKQCLDPQPYWTRYVSDLRRAPPRSFGPRCFPSVRPMAAGSMFRKTSPSAAGMKPRSQSASGRPNAETG